MILDAVMTILMLLAFAYQLTGNLFHEIIGITQFGLFIAHNLLNIKWYRNLLKGKYNGYRYLMAITNIVLLICMLVVAGSGIMISRDIFSFLNIDGGFAIRSIHTTAAQWGLLFISVHLGLHWNMILRVLNNSFFRN